MRWTETEQCRHHVHCRACLSGKLHESNTSDFFELPEPGTCPHGVTLQSLPAPRAAAQKGPRWNPLCRHGRRQGCCRVECGSPAVEREVVPARECTRECPGFEPAAEGA